MRTDNEFLDQQRLVTDAPADELIARIYQQDSQQVLYQYLQVPYPQVSTLKLSVELEGFLLANKALPAWYDKAQILSGQQFFTKYAQEIMTLLGSLALPYCYAASPGNKALYLSEKMSHSPGKRLRETAQFIMDVLTPRHLEHDQCGHIQINRTRLIHAMARYHLKQRGGWNLVWGEPISQEDMAGTNLAFSSVILKGLKNWGFNISDEQGENFLLVWRYIGYQLHIDDQLLPSCFQEAIGLEEAIKQRHFKKSEEGVRLARALVDYYKEYFAGVRTTLIEPQMIYFIGKENAALLGLESSRGKDRVVRSLNALTCFINSIYVNPNSYRNMVAAQELLKARIHVGERTRNESYFVR